MSIENMTREQLLEIVRRLPLTADGVTVFPGDAVFFQYRGQIIVEYVANCERTYHGTLVSSTYSSWKAAEQAAKKGTQQ